MRYSALRLPQIVGHVKALEGRGIDGHDVRAATLQFEREPAVPSANVEGALAVQIGRDRKLRRGGCGGLSRLWKPGITLSIGQFHAVVPAETGEFCKFSLIGIGRVEGRGIHQNYYRLPFCGLGRTMPVL